FLFDESGEENEEARARLTALVRTTDGFELADEDLKLRGEGTLFDVKQSGMPDLKLARLAYDIDLVKRARVRAFEVIEATPSSGATGSSGWSWKTGSPIPSTGCSTRDRVRLRHLRRPARALSRASRPLRRLRGRAAVRRTAG